MGLGRATNPPQLFPPPFNPASGNPQSRELTPEEWAAGKTNLEIGLHITRDLGGLENMAPEEAAIWRRLFADAPLADDAAWRQFFPNTPPPMAAPMTGPREGETNAEWADRLNLPKASAAIKRAVAGMNLPEGKDRYVIEVADEAIQTSLDGALMSGDPNAVRALSKASLPPNSKAGRDVDDIMDRFARFGASMDSVSNWLLAAPAIYGSDTPREVAQQLRKDLKPEGWTALRGAAVARLMMLPTESNEPTLRDRSEEMMRFVNGHGQGVAAALFSPEERDVMKRYANTVRLVSTEDGSVPPSAAMRLQPLLAQLTAMVSGGQPLKRTA